MEMKRCLSFSQTRESGPLRNWCIHCFQHVDNHEVKVENSNANPVGNAPNKPSLFSNVIVFDLDKTLCCKDVSILDVESTHVIRLCYGSQSWLFALRTLFQELKESDIEIIICTRNHKGIATQILHIGSLLPYISTILADEEFEWGSTLKSTVIRDYLQQTKRNNKPLRMLFIDDDIANIRDVAAAYPESRLIYVAGKTGMCDRDVTEVREWISSIVQNGTKTGSSQAPEEYFDSEVSEPGSDYDLDDDVEEEEDLT